MESQISGVVIRPIKRYTDARGWLMEMFRDDELPKGFDITMGYLSMTHPGVTRGPHEHREQTDGFVFLSGLFEVTLWENRAGAQRLKEVFLVGEETPVFMTVPPGVVHAYRNVGATNALVLNFPDRLYAGWGRKEPVDEIRHEEINSEFKV